MRKEERDQAVKDVCEILLALEPWLVQLIKFNSEEKYLGPVRIGAAERLVNLMDGITKREH